MTAATQVSQGTLSNVGGAMSWSLVGRVVRQIFGIAASIIIVRSLGQFNYGVYALLVSMLTFATAIGRGGLTEAMLRYLPELRVKGHGPGMRRLLWTVVKFQTVLAAVVLLLGWVLRDNLADLFRRPELAGLVAVALGVAVFEVYFETINQSAIALYETKTVAVSSAIASIITLATLVLFVQLGLGIVGVMLSTAAGHVCAAVLLVRKVLQHIRSTQTEDASSIRTRRLLNYAMPFLAVNVMVLITWRQSETVFLSYYWTPVEAGLFDLAYRMPQRLLEFVPGAIYPLVMAGFSEAITKDLDSMRRGIVSYYKLLFVLVAPISFFGILYADRFIEVMYGAEMAAAGPLCQVFFVVFMSSFFGTPLSMAIYAVEKTWANMIFYLVSTVVIVGLDILLIPKYGLWGAVVPVTLITVASPFVRYVLARHLVGGITIPWAFISRMYLASAPMAVFYPARERLSFPLGLAVLCVGAAAVFYAGIRIVRVFREEERSLLERSNLPFRSIILRLV